MERILTVHAGAAAPVRHVISAPAAAGGSRADAILLPGAPPGALRLVPTAAGVVVEAGTVGVRVAGRAVHPGARRLLRPGERADAAGSTIVLGAPPPADGTRAAASPLLRGEVAGDGPAVVVLTGPRAGERHPLGAGLTAGRGRAAALRLPDPLCSRVHVRIVPAPGGALVEDLGSKNGVRVNGVKLDRRAGAARPGDEIALGDTALGLEDPWAREGPADEAASPGERARRSAGAPVPALAAALLLAVSAAALALAGS